MTLSEIGVRDTRRSGSSLWRSALRVGTLVGVPHVPRQHSADSREDLSHAAFLDELYDQLRAIARARLASETNYSLQCTDLVHEAYLRLATHPALQSRNRAVFFHCAAEAMRRVLIDHARGKARQKRGAGRKPVAIDVAQLGQDGDPDEIVALNEAICRLEVEQPVAAQIVKLRFFTGLTVEETAAITALSPRTVKREWQYARAWLFRAMLDRVDDAP